jgi:hypothetical protein
MRQDTSSNAAADLAYSYKPSLMGAPYEFRLHPDALEWRLGPRAGRVPYRAIRRVRLSFQPATMQGRRFVTELWAADAPKLAIVSTSWRGLAEQAAQDTAYAGFVRELHRRLAAAGSTADFDAGRPPVLYWPGLVVFAAAVAALVLLTVHALLTGAWTGAAVIGGLGALLAWQSGAYFWRNYPGRYRPDALPARLLA